MTPRLVLNYEYYTYIEMIMMQSLHQILLHSIMMQSFSSQKVTCDVCVNGTPVPSLCPTGRDGTLSPL